MQIIVDYKEQKNDCNYCNNILEAIELFKKLWRNYADEKAGLYIAGKTY